ncbi:MAG: hypothetical protein DRP51_00625 [Candidatus Zixiibacteriota bacterium]|nr:MAG: hypothetical protein DRP51_00625 [candidate division Zixibacteria bacterium]HHI03683.1 hypothetical protein [candidate division Zixibacteria bacterium]
MKFFARFFLTFIAVIWFSSPAFTLPSVDGKVFGLYPITNEVSFLKNVDDAGLDRGLTMQIIAINSFKLWTEFTFEFTADFNWDMAYELDGSIMSNDHYIELSLVKPVIKNLSLNYQRIYSTFEPEPINQFGFRLSF